jgi:predicted RND superfamily exporter protein
MEKEKMPFDKINYILMVAGLAVLLIGFLVMYSENAAYGFGFKALTLSPIIILLGFGIEFAAIFYTKKTDDSNTGIDLKK